MKKAIDKDVEEGQDSINESVQTVFGSNTKLGEQERIDKKIFAQSLLGKEAKRDTNRLVREYLKETPPGEVRLEEFFFKFPDAILTNKDVVNSDPFKVLKFADRIVDLDVGSFIEKVVSVFKRIKVYEMYLYQLNDFPKAIQDRVVDALQKAEVRFVDSEDGLDQTLKSCHNLTMLNYRKLMDLRVRERA